MALVIPLVLAFLFFGIGLSLQWKDFARVLSYKKAFFYSALCQYIIFPSVCFGVCALLQVPAPIAIGILITAFCPSSTTSNIYTFIFKGDTAFSVGLTAISAILTPFTIPLLTTWSIAYFYGETKVLNLPVMTIMMQTLALTTVPLLLGMGFRRVNLMFALWSKRPFEILASPAIMVVVLGLVLQYGYLVSDLEIAIPVSLLLLVFSISLGLIGRNAFKLPERQARTISFEVCLQNGATGALIAVSILEMPEVISGMCTYGVLMIFSAYIWGYYLEKKVPINRYQRTALVKKAA